MDSRFVQILFFLLFFYHHKEIEFSLTENEGKLHKKKINGEDLPGRDEIEDDHEDSQFFKTASKAMSKLNMRRSISVESTKQPSIKEFKSPKAKIPLQIIVRSIFIPVYYLGKSFQVNFEKQIEFDRLLSEKFKLKKILIIVSKLN